MAAIKVFYDFHEDGVKPMTMVVDFAPDGIPWELNALYIRLDAPFEQQMAEDYNDGDLTAAVLLEDLIVTRGAADRFGIALPQLKRKCEEELDDIGDIRQLAIRICDIEEALQLSVGTALPKPAAGRGEELSPIPDRSGGSS